MPNQMAVVAHGSMGYGENKKDPPYIPRGPGGKRESMIQKVGDEKDPEFNTNSEVRQ